MNSKVALTVPWTMNSRNLAADVRWELRHQLTALSALALWTMLPVLLLTLSALWQRVDPQPLLNWAGMAALQTIGSAYNSHVNRKRLRERNSRDNFVLRNSVYFGLVGLVWGLLPLVAALSGDERASWLALLIGMAIMTSLTLILSTSHRIFYTALAGSALPMLAAVVVGPAYSPELLALGLIYVLAQILMHNTLYQVHLDRVHASLRNEAHAAALANTLEHHDALTGLYNRTGLLRWLQLFPYTPGYRAVTIVLGNIKGFSDINLLHGSSVGDSLLVELAGRMVRQAGDTICLTRLNGAEFLLADARADADSEALSGMLASLEKEDFLISDRVINISFQQCTLQGRPGDIDTLIETARSRIQQGRQDPVGTLQDDAQVLNLRRELVGSFHEALNSGAIQPWFQPIIDCAGNRIIGWEALARWQHPQRGVLKPDEFLEIARISGYMTQLTRNISCMSLDFIKRLDREEQGEAASISINFTVGDLSASDTLDWITKCLQDHNVPAARMSIEISEKEALLQDQQLSRNLEDLQAMGMQLAIDDFGTGYANIGQLLDLPASTVKLDMRFIRKLPHDSHSATLVRAIIGMARSMGKRTIAEGVERKEQLEFLRDAGCSAYQGFLAGPALPAHDALELARSW